jgi:HD superfamily phosphohydrolase
LSKPIEVRCPIYGFIPLDEWEHDVIETPELRRLRRIRQLAWTDYVYPGAMHTRFEHTLGVMHMARMLFEQLTRPLTRSRRFIVDHFGGNEDQLRRYDKLVRLAALLHDVGHSPFSHGGEELFPSKGDGTGERFQHEEYSAALITHNLRSVIDDHPRDAYGIRADEVADLILGSAEAGAALFWRPLISGQLDADRMDYLLRDSHHAGVQYGRYDWHRIINTATVAPPEEDRGPRVGVTEGGWNAAEGLIIARYMMFNQVYYHKTRVALDFHLQCALSEVLPGGHFPLPTESGLQDYLDWDDWRVLGLFAAGEGGEHGKRLRERDLFREIRHTPAYPEKSDDKLLERWRRQLGGLLVAEIPSKRSWYKVDDTDIPVVTEDANLAVRPLSYYSPIVKKMETMRQVRLYVRGDDRNKAEELIAKVERGKK